MEAVQESVPIYRPIALVIQMFSIIPKMLTILVAKYTIVIKLKYIVWTCLFVCPRAYLLFSYGPLVINCLRSTKRNKKNTSGFK